MTDALEQAGFTIKDEWTTNNVVSGKQEKSLLGLNYSQVEDQLYINPSFNLSKCVRGEKSADS